MKRIFALLIALTMLLSACGTPHNDNTDTGAEKENTAMETMNGTTHTTEGSATTEGSGETGGTETTQGTENTEGNEGTTNTTAGTTTPTQGSAQPTEGNKNNPTEGAKPNETEPPATTQPPATQPTTPTQPEVKLSISPTSLSLVVGNTSTLTASYNGTGTLSWSSDKSSVVTVSNGKVTAKAAGTATITVTDGNKSATCKITVTAPVTTTLEINTKSDTTITVGSTLQIDYTYSGNKSELTWTSSDTSVITVNSNGVVTGIAAGNSLIKVTNGEITDRIYIIVEDAKPLATSFKKSEYNAPLYDGVVKYAGDYMNFKVNVQPDASNPNITVTSSNTSVVSVSWDLNYSNINVVILNFKSAGTATVTITSADGAYSESYSITVKGDYACNPGSGQLTPEQFVNAYNGVVSANGMSTSGMPTGYLVLTLSDSELTWATARRNAEGRFHAWWAIGYRTLVLTYEGINESGNHVFYVRGY